jgi:holin-like protein
MSVIYEIATIFIIYISGAALSLIIPVPGSLLSMGIFFILLLTGVLKEKRYTMISGIILRNLAFFFIPPAVKIIDSADILSGNAGKILLIIVVSNILVMAVSGTVVQFFLKRSESKDD